MGLINILADTTMCSANSMKRIFALVGNLFNIIKIVVPIIIIIMGTIDLVKAMIANKPDETKKAQTTFIKRLIASVCIFFVFPIISFLMGLLGENMDNQCMTCFSYPNDKTKCYYTIKSNTNSSSKKENQNNSVEHFDTNKATENVSTSASR